MIDADEVVNQIKLNWVKSNTYARILHENLFGYN